ncbi:chemotaxis response regulator protein-glutamate methylesterase [Pseudomonas stutzeri]|uniref:protein-glutamate methylesterase/protein-glutamine glutaminase n=1 Tax=Stutzerimonas stutzeri TaxID=316 RepID=UPI00210AED4A|nr:chemotaxis response regulator protein-glutamate methylesterase [Stutzerimonas stutzeri]
MSKKISVFIVDDSAVVRQVVAAVLGQDQSIEVIGSASDPLFALQKMQTQWPDVILLDVEMPRMDGITFLKKIMSERPTPVVICSTLTEKGAQTSVDALAAGAVEIITKPKIGLKDFLNESSAALIRAVKAAARARVSSAPVRAAELAVATAPVAQRAMAKTTESVIALGTSTGGIQALQTVLTSLPEDCPGIVVVQHMPEKFTAAFADRLNRLCRCEVNEAANSDRVRPGRVLIAPGGRHMQLKRSGAQYHVTIQDGPPVNRHKPSVDVLFRSVAREAGKNAIGVIMTGMGDDGARGLLEMREAGALTAAQDEASCVVFGMPKEAIARGAAAHIIALSQISRFILGHGH